MMVQKILRYWYGVVFVIGAVLFGSYKISATYSVKPYCIKQKPTAYLVLVPVSDFYKLDTYPLSIAKIAQEIQYESIYIRNMKYPVVNAVVGDSLEFLTCKQYDVSLPYVNINKFGGYIFAYEDNFNKDLIRDFVEKYAIEKIYTGSIVIKDNKPGLVNLSECKTLCSDINTAHNWLEARGYTFSVEEVEYPGSIKQNQDLSVKVKITNKSNIAFPPKEYAKLQLIQIKGDRVYSNSWVDLNIVAYVNPDSYWMPNTDQIISFKTGKFLLPGNYSAVFALKINKKVLKDTQFIIKFKVKDTGLDLAEIRPREGDIANVHKDPSLGSKTIFKLHRGDIVIWHKQDGAWVLIETKEGKKGWVYRPFVWPLK